MPLPQAFGRANHMQALKSRQTGPNLLISLADLALTLLTILRRDGFQPGACDARQAGKRARPTRAYFLVAHSRIRVLSSQMSFKDAQWEVRASRPDRLHQ